MMSYKYFLIDICVLKQIRHKIFIILTDKHVNSCMESERWYLLLYILDTYTHRRERTEINYLKLQPPPHLLI